MKIYSYSYYFHDDEILITEYECVEKEKTYKTKNGRVINKNQIDTLGNFNNMYSLSKDNAELFRQLLLQDNQKDIEAYQYRIKCLKEDGERIKNVPVRFNE